MFTQAETLEQPRSLISLVKQSVSESGFSLSERNTMRGISGNLHEFALIARSPSGKKVVVNIVGKEKFCELSLVKLKATTYDCSPDLSILLAIPSANRFSRELASSYGIKLIEGKDIGEICSKLQATLKAIDA